MQLRNALVLTGVVVAVLFSGCAHKASNEVKKAEDAPAAASTDSKQQVLPLRFAKVERRMWPQTLDLNGTLVADETSEVAAQASGVVNSVAIDVGSRVKKGEVMVTLDNREAALRSAQAKATLEQNRNKLGLVQGQPFDPKQVPDVRSAKDAMDLAVKDAERQKALVDSGSVSQAAWDQTRTKAEQAKAQYDSALSKARQDWSAVSSAQSQLGLAEKSLADTSIRAPFEGAVAERRISVGEFANIGRIVAVVVRDQPLRLQMDVAEVDLQKIQLGKKVQITVAAYPGRVFEGSIKRIGAELKSQTRSLLVEAEVLNQDSALRAGFFAQARVTLPGNESPALLVPEAAIGTTGTASRVFVRAGNRVVEKLVKVGRREGDKMEIIGLVSENDEVAIEGVDKLSDGSEVANETTRLTHLETILKRHEQRPVRTEERPGVVRRPHP